MKFAVDTLGSDLGSKEFVEGIRTFLSLHSDVEIYAYGKKEELEKLSDICTIIDAPEVVPMEAGPLEVMHLKNSSMLRAIKDYKDFGFDGILSCGSTGGYLSCATLVLKNIPGIKRGALVSPFPTFLKNKKTVVLDVGANNENSPEELYQFALMGQQYAKIVLNIENPNVYLLSNGVEKGKGSPTSKLAYDLFLEKELPNFKGNKEAREALDGSVDVLVCDGFNGNIFLKSTEGMAKSMGMLIKKAFKKNLWTKLGYLHVKKEINEINEILDYKAIGGACLLGVNGLIVKGHGNSDAMMIKNSLNVLYKAAKDNLIEKIKGAMNHE